MNTTAKLLSPSQAAEQLGVSTKALRLYDNTASKASSHSGGLADLWVF